MRGSATAAAAGAAAVVDAPATDVMRLPESRRFSSTPNLELLVRTLVVAAVGAAVGAAADSSATGATPP
uniref:Putative secreted protein n=1 Tax=Anopheles darlingi TaxID=43151 RepID=A0A2M4DEY0_ANODA